MFALFGRDPGTIERQPELTARSRHDAAVRCYNFAQLFRPGKETQPDNTQAAPASRAASSFVRKKSRHPSAASRTVRAQFERQSRPASPERPGNPDECGRGQDGAGAPRRGCHAEPDQH